MLLRVFVGLAIVSLLVVVRSDTLLKKPREDSREEPSGDSLEEPTEEAVTPSDEPFTCEPERNFIRVGGTYNDPSTLRVDTPLECCRICSDDPRCQTWSRDRLTGACALKETISPLFPDERYDSGSFDAVAANAVTTVSPCESGAEMRFPGGIVLMRRRSSSAQACCEMCREDLRCFSWDRDQDNGRCTMNEDVPNSRSDPGYRGNSLI